ncbi:MAG TPA: cytochrome c oxidase accessory protein CcoG, partial [Steroidobacteraceae bacterium]
MAACNPQAAGDSLYLAEAKVYPREVSGRFARLRTLSVWVLLGIFYLLPWLQWGGRQAVLFDLPARKFFILGLVFWPQDFIFLTWLLIIAALALFFFTAIGGRLWCGYACPQTVWTETFLWMERFAEGDRGARLKLDKAPWSPVKFGRKSLKQLLWITFALWTGFTFVGFFTPIRTLSGEVLGLGLGPWETFWILFYGFATYGNAGYLREQVCKYMCPYARFQSAMFDRDTLVITYDEKRGEPRGARRRGTDARTQGKGDCIDCTLCVQVCPTGIDIRKGLQIECIACAACIDVCDDVMDKMGSPRGLIRYTTTHSLEHLPTRILRPRTLIYGSILGLLMVGFVVAVAMRSPVSLDVIRDRNALFKLTDDGNVDNVYTIRILNKSE